MEWFTASCIREKQNSMEPSETQTVNNVAGVKIPIEKNAFLCQHQG